MIRPTMRRAKSTGSRVAPTMRRTTSDGGNARRPVKKLVVSMKKKKTALPADFFEVSWAKLKAAVDAVHTQTAVSYSREQLYQAVETMCGHKMSANLFDRLSSLCEDHISLLVAALQGQTQDATAFLRKVLASWEQHCSQMVTIRSIFLVLDRKYVMETDMRSLWDMGLGFFCKHLKSRPTLLSKVVDGLLDLISCERRGESISRSMLAGLVRMLCQLKIYHTDFEALFLEESAKFYRQEGQQRMESADVAQYLRHVQRRLNEESDRVAAYLDHTTRRDLLKVVEQELLTTHSQSILDKGFGPLMDAHKQDDLKLMYKLLHRISSLQPLNEQFKAYVKVKGAELVSDPEKDKEMVQGLLELRAKLDDIHATAFAKNDEFKRSLKASFEFFINTRHNKPAEMIAKFVDKQLKSSKGSSESEIEDLLDRVMELFRSINGKDVFEAFYKKDLAKRLLLDRSASVDLELSMLSKLKTECGSVFTSKLEGMFKDVKLSKELMAEFKASVFHAGANVKFDTGVHVLTTTYWPSYEIADLVLPAAMGAAQDAFKTFYDKKFNGRRLAWAHNLGHCLLRAKFPSGRKELAVSLYQTVVLLLFNNVGDGEELDFKAIQEQTGLDDQNLKLTLVSLACGRARVLTKNPKSRHVDVTDKFAFNTKFKAKLVRIKINSVQMKETAKEQKETEKRVFKERLYQIDAAIVRIMKSRKTLSHTSVMSELFTQLRFPAEPSQIKKRIESLLEREYLERDEDTPSIYHYVA